MSSADRQAKVDAINRAFDEADRSERAEEVEDDASMLQKAERAMGRRSAGSNGIGA